MIYEIEQLLSSLPCSDLMQQDMCNKDAHIQRTVKQVPGFMKSDRPKSVAFRGESSMVDLKRKFWEGK
jgi:hypothetical protein